jgi:hypothetical protein
MSEVATSGPVPSKFVFLHEVASLASGTKVRFLGWYEASSVPIAVLLTSFPSIVQYDGSQSRVLLEHAFPKDTSPVPSIWVDLTLVLETTKSTTLSPGTWINVIGYVRVTPRASGRKSGNRFRSAAQSLQAVLIWDAGAVRIGDYENTLEEAMHTQRRLELTRT